MKCSSSLNTMTRCLLLCVLILAVSAQRLRGVNGQPGRLERRDVTSERFHAFFYLWYGVPEVDGRWKHWNHSRLPHWNEGDNRKSVPKWYLQRKEPLPPEVIHSPFYPHRGCYSSLDLGVLVEQLTELKHRAGVGVIVASWTGRPRKAQTTEELKTLRTTDSQDINTDEAFEALLSAAEKASVKVAVHLEPYHGRSANSIRRDLSYLADRYFGRSSAIYRICKPGNPARVTQECEEHDKVPLVYVYDSYLVPSSEWSTLLSYGGPMSIRGTSSDAVFLSLLLKEEDIDFVTASGFDGIYTYFAAEGMSEASVSRHWGALATKLKQKSLLFSPSVGPGYDDSGIRPWNIHNKRERRNGEYYHNMLSNALAAQPDFVSITSYNEWGEGTQIEPAASMRGKESTMYNDYHPGSPFKYLDITRKFVMDLEDGVLHVNPHDVPLKFTMQSGSY